MLTLLCIGSCCNPRKNSYSGQAVMFDGVVNHLRQHGEKIKVVDITQKMPKDGTFYRSLDYVVILLSVFTKLLSNRIDLCYITSSQSKKGFLRDYAMVILCRWFKVPVILHQYGANYHQLIDALGKRGLMRLKRMLEYVSTVIVEGDYMKEQFSFLPGYETKVKVIPNGLPVEGKHAKISKIYDDDQPFVMFYLSNLIWSKGYFDVLQSVDILVNRKGMNVKCVFAGQFMASVDDKRTGIDKKAEFEKYINDHSLSDRVEYHTGLYGEEKDACFHRANVFLLPTYYINEGQPVSVIEALAYGCVPVVTEYRHIPMMVTRENGCFVEPQKPEQIAEIVAWLMEHPKEYSAKSRASIKDYKEKFTFDKFAVLVQQCMSEVVKN